MADELTVTIARVLREHQRDSRLGLITAGGNTACVCGWVGLNFAAHQAEAVRAALGETTTEWAVDEIDHEWRTVSSPEKAETLMPGRPLYRRTVTPWVEVPRG